MNYIEINNKSDAKFIDWTIDENNERSRLATISHKTGLKGLCWRFIEHSSVWFILILTGLSTGSISALLDVVTDWFADIRVGHCSTSAFKSFKSCCPQKHMCEEWINHTHSTNITVAIIIYILSAILFTLFTSFIVTKVAPLAYHTGIPEMKAILGGFILPDFLSPRTLLVKAIGLCLAVSSGLSVGKEGPLIHVTCCISELFMKLSYKIGFAPWSNSEIRKRQIYAAAAAAGVSVAFGAPLGGVMFALEELDIHLFPTQTLWQAFVCAALAAVTLQWFNPFGTGKLVLFSVTANQSWKQFELIFWVILGAIGGIVGASLIKLNILFANIRQNTRIKNYRVIECTIVAGITAILSYPSVITRVQSSSLVAALFQECSDDPTLHITAVICDSNRRAKNVILLSIAAVFKLIMTAYTFGIAVPAGVFLPGLTIGACIGRCLGGVLKIIEEHFSSLSIFADCNGGHGCILPGLYATVGAAATLSSITRMTVSLVVIVFELTGALSHVVPIMIAVMTAKWVGDAFGRDGIYSAWINFHKYIYIPQTEFRANGIKGEDIADVEVPVLEVEGESIYDLQEFFTTESTYDGYAIVKGHSKVFVGYISRNDIEFILNDIEHFKYDKAYQFEPHTNKSKIDLSDYVNKSQLFFYPLTPVEIIVSTFQKMGIARAFIITQSGTFVGIIKREQISSLVFKAMQHSSNIRLNCFNCLKYRKKLNIDNYQEFELESA